MRLTATSGRPLWHWFCYNLEASEIRSLEISQELAILAFRQAVMNAIQTPVLSIVIVNYGTWPDVIAQTETILSSRPFENGQIEVVVVDNHSPTSPPSNRPQLHGLTWLDMPTNGGFGAGANAGWHTAKGQWLLILNPDVSLTGDFFSHVLALLDEIHSSPSANNAGIVGIGLTNPDGSRQPSVGAFPTVIRGLMELFIPRTRRRYQIVSPQKFGPVDWVTGAFFLVRTRLMHDLNGFDEDYFLYFEETDFCHRARLNGWLTCFEPSLTVCHQKPLQNRSVSPMIRLWTRHSRLLYFRKNRPRLEFRVMLGVVRLEAFLKASLAKAGFGSYPPEIWNAIHHLTTRFQHGTEPLGTDARDWAYDVVSKLETD
jgi:N-acetylglucosaminyl-diphospho-decaprenol L-rhamnosyltransferase